uniref:hypothetical protein n=1 Tax=Streptomyces tubercidicus TaxID=47759 RepID=UPI0037DD523A|nr:hypothetical protein OG690_38105 [Streptomyces tubercidicus]
MGNQEQDSATRTAATGMRILRDGFTAPRARQPDAGPTATRVHAPPPCDLGLLDHLRSTREELIAATRAALAGQPLEPAPADEGIYQWNASATAHLPLEKQQACEAIVYRQSLEHAIRAGDDLIIRRQRCPGCRCFSLMWRDRIQRAVCIQRGCRDHIGRASQWELKQIAHHHVTSRPQRAAS